MSPGGGKIGGTTVTTQVCSERNEVEEEVSDMKGVTDMRGSIPFCSGFINCDE